MRRHPTRALIGVLCFGAASLTCRRAGPEDGESPHCPFREEEWTLAARESLRSPPPTENMGIRFSHISALTPEPVEVKEEKPSAEPDKTPAVFQPWEIVQLVVIIACAVAIVWIAHRKFEG